MKKRHGTARSDADPARLEFVRSLPCCVVEPYLAPKRSLAGQVGWCLIGDTCSGPMVAHHPRGLKYGTGTGVKAPDALTIPVCRKHHDEWHALAGIFAHFDQAFTAHDWQDYHVERVAKIPTPGRGA